MSAGLTEPQRRHLKELLHPDGKGTLYWHVTYGSPEHRCAVALQRKGLVAGNAISSNDAYYLTDKGLRAALELASAGGERDG